MIMREDLGFDTKEKVFKAVSRSILCYGAQVWRGAMHEEAEKLLRFFVIVKKHFTSPNTHPQLFCYLN